MEIAAIVLAIIAMVFLAWALGSIGNAFQAMLTKDDERDQNVEIDE